MQDIMSVVFCCFPLQSVVSYRTSTSTSGMQELMFYASSITSLHTLTVQNAQLGKGVHPLTEELTFWHRSFTFNSNKSPT